MPAHHDPIVQRLFASLQTRIAQGHYCVGEWLPTEREIAIEFAVSRAVVRAALTMLAEEAWIERQPGRRPWVSRSGPKSERKPVASIQTITAVLPQQTAFPSSLAILSGINCTLRLESKPYRLVIYDNYDVSGNIHMDVEHDVLRTARIEGNGVILWSMNVRQLEPELRALRDAGVPVVFIDRYSDEIEGDFVGVDNRDAAAEAIQHLRQLGHTRIGYIASDEYESTSTTRERAVGYREALRQHNLYTPELIWTMRDPGEHTRPAAEYFLGLSEPPTAVFTNNDYIAYRLIEDLERLGIQVPHDMSIVGFDDIDQFSPRPARLTTVHQPFHNIGRRAAGLLLDRLAEGTKPRTVWKHLLLPTTLKVRQTCGKPRLK